MVVKIKILLAVCLILGSLNLPIMADDQIKNEQAATQPAMGPTPEMRQFAFLLGTWDVAQSWKMDPAKEEWTDSKAVSTFVNLYDGCGIHQSYEGEVMNMPFKGTGLSAFNRETGKWQSVWLDNMGAAIGYYEGYYKDGKMVVQGEDTYGGQKYITRITTLNYTAQRFEWTLEMSMDGGKTFITTGKAVYTKPK